MYLLDFYTGDILRTNSTIEVYLKLNASFAPLVGPVRTKRLAGSYFMVNTTFVHWQNRFSDVSANGLSFFRVWISSFPRRRPSFHIVHVKRIFDNARKPENEILIPAHVEILNLLRISNKFRDDCQRSTEKSWKTTHVVSFVINFH